MSYETRFAWSVVSGGTLLGRPEELEAWRVLIEAAESYPNEKYMPPLRPPKGKERTRDIGAMVWEYDGTEVLTSRITAVTIAVGSTEERCKFGDDDEQNAAELARLLLLPDCRGAMLAAWGAANGGFHTALRQFARALVRLGWSIEPVATGTRCKALILRYKRRAIWLTDAQEMTGAQALTREVFCAEYAPRSRAELESARRLADALGGFQRQLSSMFGVAMHATIGSAALRAAQSYIGAQKHVWRPSPLLVTMLREGHGFRGGYAYAQRYDGEAWRVDMNKAYTAALAERLPLRAALVPAGPKYDDAEGVFMCEVKGPGAMPIYIAPYDRLEHTFKPDYWNGKRAWCILTTSELLGIRSLGFTVTKRAGFAYVRDWTLAPFASRIAELCAQHGRGSAHERTAKVIGNSVYGKFAERPDREQVMYNSKRPGPDWHPMVDLRGEELPDLWTSKVTTYRPGQHVELAATITGRVRGWLYEAMSITHALGGEVVHADTDGLITTVPIGDFLTVSASRLGAWRVESDPQRAIVWGRKGYAFGNEVRASGFAGLDSGHAADLAAGEAVETHYTVTPAPWKSRAGVTTAKRTARATA